MNYQKFTGMSVGERILKIGEHLAKLERKMEWHLFRDTVQYCKLHLFFLLSMVK